MKKLSLALILFSLFINTSIFGSTVKNESQTFFNSNSKSYSPELFLLNYLRLDSFNYFLDNEIQTFSQVGPASLPYQEDFETTNQWVSVGTELNEWFVGTAIANGGTHSLYISDDNGASHHYDGSATNVTHVYRDILIEDLSGEINIQFDWLCNGVSEWGDSFDGGYFNAWLVPSSYTPSVGVLIEDEMSNGFKIVNKFKANPTDFLTEDIVFSLSNLPAIYTNGEFRIVFEWRNDGFLGTGQPPAAIDNLSIQKVSCPKVINMASQILDDGNALLTWEATGNETQWEVIVFPLDGGALPDENTIGVIVNEPQYIYTEGEADQFYRFFIRPICSQNEKGSWSTPSIITYIPLPGCAEIAVDIEMDGTVLTPNEDGSYILCEDGPSTVRLNASYFDIKKTDQYVVEQIEYLPPFPFTGGGAVELTKDDIWSEVIDLGFDFCFFGNKFDKVLINTNGAITFSVKGVVNGGLYTPGAGAPYKPIAPIPSPPDADPEYGYSPIANSIMGVFQDMNPDLASSPADFSINYQVIGKAPCRMLVFNIYNLGLFSCNFDPENIDESTQTSQIVLYEGTNIIDVYVKNRPSCPTAWQGGGGVIGIQNENGTQAYTPDERNTGEWTTTNEAWRFSPAGDSSIEFNWKKDGVLISSEPEINVTINESAIYTATASYAICGQEFTITKDFNFIKEDFEIGKAKDLIDCTKKPGTINVFDLSTNNEFILGDLDSSLYTIEYFHNEADATLGENQLPAMYETLNSRILYAKLTNLNSGCYKIQSFNLIIEEPLEVTQIENAWRCEPFIFPALNNGESYYTQPYGGGEQYESGEMFEALGIHTLYVYKETKEGCIGQSEFEVEIVATPKADIIKDQLLKCITFFLPKASPNNKYYTEAEGKGIELQENAEITQPMTVYIYAKVDGPEGVSCIDESSFRIEFEECPIPKGISPNGDNINDSFDLSGYGISNIVIYNRYGTEVFSYGLGYINEWYGQDKSGNQLPDGTYYYSLISNGKIRTGWVQINK